MPDQWVVHWSDGSDGQEMGPFWELELDVSGFESSEPSAEFGRMLTEKLAVEEGRIVTAALADLETAYISEVSRSYK